METNRLLKTTKKQANLQQRLKKMMMSTTMKSMKMTMLSHYLQKEGKVEVNTVVTLRVKLNLEGRLVAKDRGRAHVDVQTAMMTITKRIGL